MTKFSFLFCVLATFCLSGCLQDSAPSAPSAQSAVSGNAPENAPLGTCWDRSVLLAPVPPPEDDTQTDIAPQTPPEDITDAPTAARPDNEMTAHYSDWVEVICPTDLKQPFAASLQRALRARGYYTAAITGHMNSATRQALHNYQTDEGVAAPTPGILTVAAARRLGLRAVERATL